MSDLNKNYGNDKFFKNILGDPITFFKKIKELMKKRKLN